MIHGNDPKTKRNHMIQWKKIQKPFHLKPGTGSIQFWITQEGNKRVVLCRYSIKHVNQFIAK